jgi:argininosuccinate lyase
MKLWEKGLPLEKEIEDFTVGNDRVLDLELAPYDVLGSLAHARMLASCGLLSDDEHAQLQQGLLAIMEEIEAGSFRIEDDVEDVHSQIELLLTRSFGEAGERLHTARSRNDQVLLDVKLYLRDRIRAVAEASAVLAERLLDLSDRHREVFLPGYTHMQIAMPSSFGLWFGAWAESLTDDLAALRAAYRLADRNPLGSAAGYGSSFPIDRAMTTELLGFEGLHVNSVHAQLSRGKTERAAAHAIGMTAATLVRFAMDVCQFTSGNYAFLSLDAAFTTGSSIMPHKKNPDVFELIRAKCNRIQALANDITLVTANLPSGYHRDLQILKDMLFPAFGDILACLRIAAHALEGLRVRSDIIDDARYRDVFSVDAVHGKVMEGMPFRAAYKAVADDIASGSYDAALRLQHTHIGSIGNPGSDLIRERLRREVAEFPFSSWDDARSKLLASSPPKRD